MNRFVTSLFIFFIACSQEKEVNHSEQLEALFQEIRTDIAANAKNLSRQLNAGIKGVKNLERFVQDNKISSYPTLKRWLDLYFASTQYVYDKADSRDQFLKKLLKSDAIQSDFRQSFSQAVNDYIEKDRIEREMKAKFEVGANFPLLPAGTKDFDGNSISIADYKDKVLLVDFWATWCSPCIAELPNVQAVYKKYKSKGFDILGISFDGPNRDKFSNFIKDKEMNWRHIYDGGHWDSKLSNFYGIKSIPATFLLKNGKIIAKNLRGQQLMQKVSSILD